MADSLARRDVQGIDWEELALDLLDVTRGAEDAPDWSRDDAEDLDDPDDEQPDPVAMGRLARRALGVQESATE